MDPNLTIYRKDYIPKTIKDLKAIIEKNKLKNLKCRDPIGDSYKNYLLLNGETEKNSEELDVYFEKAKTLYPWFAKVTENKPVDKNVVRKNKIFEGRTLYQVDYCDLEKDNAYKEYLKRTAVKLPLDVEIPLTSQKSGYRNPKMLDSKVYEKTVQSRPENSLEINNELREILQVTTGTSEYMGIIGKLGVQIIEEELHGIRKRET